MADQRPSPIPGDPRPRTQIVRGRTIVVGLGNPLLGDDGVGWRVADEVERRLRAADASGSPALDVEIERLGVGGLRLMECLTGYETAILIDAAEFPDRPSGEVRACPFEDLADHAAGHLDSAHDASLRTALALGRRLGANLPQSIHAVTVQARQTNSFSEELSPEVAAAIPVAADAVVALLDAGRTGGEGPRIAPIDVERARPAGPNGTAPGQSAPVVLPASSSARPATDDLPQPGGVGREI